MDYQINFPNLGIALEHVIKSFSIGNFTVAIYGVTMALALLAGLLVTEWRAKETGQNEDSYFNLFICFIIFGFLGARLYYVAFSWDYYSRHLSEILNFRGGGIAIYGGLIGGTLVAIVFCKITKMNIFTILDTVVMGVCLGQIIGRWGNFFNREAFGGYTDNLLAMQLPVSAVRSNEITQQMWDNLVTINGVDFIQVHPTFLYEGLWNLAVLILLFIFRNKTKFKGETFFRYLFGYGIGRFWIESLRTDQLIIGHTGIPISMVIAAAAVIVSVVVILVGRSRAKKAEAAESAS
ncbi:MAG: prolipoprotein diacylglyceryl transferase [Lachnospiraceae bacterium]|nr:prolipoprotein diacylglyceryl transferase [Lachnospiraceae bacterium]